MTSARLEAFSDAVIAIVMTIMVLELRAPQGVGLVALKHSVPTLLMYALSFLFLGIYWNNHHHMLALTERVNGKVLWANLHLLFWLSLVPFMTSWVGTSHFAETPTAAYGVDLLLAAVAYFILKTAIIGAQPRGSQLESALGSDTKGKLSPVLYAVAIPLAFVDRWVSLGVYVAVALMWLVPDPRIESAVADAER